MLNPERLLGQLLRGGMSRRGLRMGGKTAVGLGVLGVAMAAFEHYSKQREEQPQANQAHPPGPPPPPPRESDSEKAILLIQAMIAAAHADGIIDEDEKSKILQRSRDAGLSEPEQALLHAEMENPVSMGQLCSAARHYSLEGQVYAAALMALEVDDSRERAFLDQLKDELGLPNDRVQRIHNIL